ncbi:TfoX/Sxy family protein [Promicromonospora sp. MEB111]|uniref:TfoX/Sxy family protein n=1 Tax=Promicromonospora sp. MEB111 TaxID=3040301 RepID=UPI00254E8FB2|nr:TfoX/Sxy family protein [Promicromonospora sp. MEB111]
MAYDLELADEIRHALAGEDGLSERRMFGGLSFLVGGNLAVAVRGDGLLVRVGADDAEKLARTTAAQRAVMGARVMAGWLDVPADAVATEAELGTWVRRGVSWARTLPAN